MRVCACMRARALAHLGVGLVLGVWGVCGRGPVCGRAGLLVFGFLVNKFEEIVKNKKIHKTKTHVH